MTDLWTAYRQTHYIVHHLPPFTLRIDQHCHELDELLEREGLDCAAYITAWNPMSQALSNPENHRRQQDLGQELDYRGLKYLPGIGQHPSNGWPGEDSLLVLGLLLEAARIVAKAWEQQAFVWARKGSPVQLIET